MKREGQGRSGAGGRSELSQAKIAALRFVAYRPRFSRELSDFGRRRGWSVALIREVTSDLKKAGYLNDEKLSRALVADRKNLSRWGRGRIRQEMVRKGLAAELIDEVLDAQYSREEERELAAELLRKKFGRSVAEDPQALAGRALAYLARRGYNPGIVREVLRQFSASLKEVGENVEV